MKKFCESLRAQAMKIISFKKKKTKLLRNKQQESYENAKFCYICIKKLEQKYAQNKTYCKIRDHCHYTMEYSGPAHSIFNLKCSVPKEYPIVFHNGSNYDCHYIIKKLAEAFER